jgi:hypothetical protein
MLFVDGVAQAQSVRVKGNDYPAEIQVERLVLKLWGAGLREKWFFDIYTMGAYSESGNCSAQALMAADETKYIRIDLLREVSSAKMARALRKAFRKNLPTDSSANLKAQVEAFLSYFGQDLAQGVTIELTYVPETGTTMKQNGEQSGEIVVGTAFAQALWSCYFSSKTCCKSLKSQILAHCSK